MVQAGVNPFPNGPGFPTANTMSAAETGIPVAMSVKNDALTSSLKSEQSVVGPPTLSVPQVRKTHYINSVLIHFYPIFDIK